VAGDTPADGFPTTGGAFDVSYNGGVDVFVAKLNATGAFVYATYLGGSGNDFARGIAVDSAGNAHVTGSTGIAGVAPFFPTTVGAFDVSYNGGGFDAFVTKLNAAGSALVYSTFLGGSDSDQANDITLDAAGNAYLAGGTFSSDFPTTVGAFDVSFDGFVDAFVTALNAAGSALVQSTFLGGSGTETGLSVAVTAGGVFVAGGTDGGFPTTAGAFDVSFNGGDDAFVARFSAFVVGSVTVGLFDQQASTFFLRNTNTAGPADVTYGYGPPAAGWVPLAGDWDGNGTRTPGLYDSATGTFFLKNNNSAGPADLTFTYGPGGAFIVPVVGDWDGNGTDTVGLYFTATSAFFLRNTNTAGNADIVFGYGPAFNWRPVAGDWDGDGTDTVGLYDPTSSTFFLRNTNTAGPADLTFAYGPAGGGFLPIMGDWNQDGVTTAGVYNPATGTFFLRNSNSAGPADVTFVYGPAGLGWLPLAGDWDGL
jgi:hypothetical protein